MSESKEPGQMAYEAWRPDDYPWESTPHKAAWSAVESAIRADERERCAKIAEDHYILNGLLSPDSEQWAADSAYGKGRLDAASAIRAAKEGA